MQIKPIKDYKKLNVPTQKESKSKLLNFLIENKKLMPALTLLLLITNIKNTFAISTELSGDIQVTPGVLAYEVQFIDIFVNLTPFVIILALITLIIYNTKANKQQKNLTVENEKATFKKQRIIKNILILTSIILLWLISSFILYLI